MLSTYSKTKHVFFMLCTIVILLSLTACSTKSVTSFQLDSVETRERITYQVRSEWRKVVNENNGVWYYYPYDKNTDGYFATGVRTLDVPLSANNTTLGIYLASFVDGMKSSSDVYDFILLQRTAINGVPLQYYEWKQDISGNTYLINGLSMIYGNKAYSLVIMFPEADDSQFFTLALEEIIDSLSINEYSQEELTSTSDKPMKKASYEVVYSNARTWVNSIGTAWVQSVFEVKNTGTVPLYLSSGAYDLEGTDGLLVKSRSLVSVFPQVINPGESGYYYEETTLDNAPANGELVIIPRPDVREAKVEHIRYPITDFQLSKGSYGRGIKMMGRVENTSAEKQSLVYVSAVFLDENNNPIGVNSTIIMESIEPGSKIGFESSTSSLPVDITIDKIARYAVFAYPWKMQF